MRAPTSTRFIGWCPVCERDIKVRGNLLVHHGYQRPGIGYILGDCPGVGYRPYELGTDACVHYRDRLTAAVLRTEEYIARLQEDAPDLTLVFDDYDIATRRVRRTHLGGAPMIVTLTRAQADALEAQLPSYDKGRYSWDKKRKHVIAYQKSILLNLDVDLRRTNKLIADWPGPRPLRTTEEEISRQEQTRAEREAAKAAARDAKISAEVAKIQKRIDSAVKNRNSNALADIYASTKLREVSGYRLSKEEGLALLERDAIWRAFGLLLPNGVYLKEAEAKDVLSTMRYGHAVVAPDGYYDYRPMQWPTELGGGVSKSRR